MCLARGHVQAVRALAASPTEHTFASGAADNLKKFKLPQGDFLHNFLQHQRVSCFAGVMWLYISRQSARRKDKLLGQMTPERFEHGSVS